MKREKNENPDFQTSTHALQFSDSKSKSQIVEQLFIPMRLLYMGAALLAVTAILLAPSSHLSGYLVGVLGSVALSGALLRDQRLQATSNYVFLRWFRPSVVSIRLMIFVVSFLHVFFLALQKAR